MGQPVLRNIGSKAKTGFPKESGLCLHPWFDTRYLFITVGSNRRNRNAIVIFYCYLLWAAHMAYLPCCK